MASQDKKRKADAESGSHADKALKIDLETEDHPATAKSANTAIPTHREVLDNFLLVNHDTQNPEHLILRRIQDQFANSYNTSAILDEVRRWNPQAPKIRGRWNAMNALAQWDLGVEQDVERARRLGVEDRGPLPEDSSREDIQERLGKELEAFRHLCQSRGLGEPDVLRHALDLTEMPFLTSSILALGLPVPAQVEDARNLLQQWDIQSGKDLQTLGLDPELLEREGRPQVWSRIVEACGSVLEQATARGYNVDTSTRVYELVRMLTTSIIGDGYEDLVEACHRVGLKADVESCDLRKRLIDHERRILLVRCSQGTEQVHALETLNAFEGTSARFSPKPASPRVPAPQIAPVSTKVTSAYPELGIAAVDEEPFSHSAYLQGLGNEPASIYQQSRPESRSDSNNSLFDTFAAAFFHDPNKGAWVQKEAQEIFHLALFGPTRFVGGGWNYVRRVRHDWYREFNQKAAAFGGVSLWAQLWDKQPSTMEMVQLLADIYHIQLVVHFRTKDHYWDMVARGPTQLEGARKQIHLIHWRDEDIWTVARRVTPGDTWLANFPNHPLSLMPLIPAPNFTDGLRPVPLARNPSRGCEEDYQLEMNDPPRLPPGPTVQEGLSDDEDGDGRNGREEEKLGDAGEANRRAIESWAAHVSSRESGTDSKLDEGIEDKPADRATISKDQGGESLKPGDNMRDTNPQEHMDLGTLRSGIEPTEASEIEKWDDSERPPVEREIQEEQEALGFQADTEHFEENTEVKDQGRGGNGDEAHLNQRHHSVVEEQESPPQEEPRESQYPRSLSDPLSYSSTSGPRIPGLSLLNGTDEEPSSKAAPLEGSGHTFKVPSPSEDELFQEMKEAPSLIEQASTQESHNSRSSAPSPEPDHPSRYERQRYAGEATFDDGAIRFQGQRVPLHDEDNPSENAIQRDGRVAEEDEENGDETPCTLADSIEDDGRTGYAEDLEDPLDDWQDRTPRTQERMNLARSPLQRELPVDAYGDDGFGAQEYATGQSGEHESEAGYDSLFGD
ncbi:hypothetical protein EV356DRAFT_577213 [Viridothelium virens]|uniref:Uncharacterized protein n=1 Tax=Viridothelium virens TaxID=1048519 RepID=A0A6A6H755_VIRVR|nr:hypothetical protein EV356DRAFT_577213 [Viridothelium virens]